MLHVWVCVFVFLHVCVVYRDKVGEGWWHLCDPGDHRGRPMEHENKHASEMENDPNSLSHNVFFKIPIAVCKPKLFQLIYVFAIL